MAASDFIQGGTCETGKFAVGIEDALIYNGGSYIPASESRKRANLGWTSELKSQRSLAINLSRAIVEPRLNFNLPGANNRPGVP